MSLGQWRQIVLENEGVEQVVDFFRRIRQWMQQLDQSSTYPFSPFACPNQGKQPAAGLRLGTYRLAVPPLAGGGATVVCSKCGATITTVLPFGTAVHP